MNTPPFKDNKGNILRCGENNSSANRKKIHASSGISSNLGANLVGIKLNDDGCPEGYKCHIGGLASFCCSTKPNGTVFY